MESMDNRGDISFSSVIDHFSEETQQAREILRNIHFYQNSRLPPGLSSPFADLSGISQEDHSILEKFFDQELKKVAENTQSTQAGESTADLNNVMQPWFPLARLPVVEDIARLMGRAKPSEESAYSFMVSVLQQYHLVYYRGIFYCQENCIFRPVSEQELRSIIFPIVEPALAAGKNAKLIGNIIDLLKDCPYTKAYQTTETPDRIFFINGVYDLVHHTLGPLQPTDFVTSYLPFQYIANNAACPEFDHFLIRISGGDNAIISLIWEMIGYLLSNANERELTPVYLISFLTQKMLLVAIYERWNEVKVSEAAERLSVSRKSASRCFDELEYLNIDVLGMKGKSRVINVPDDRKEFWKENIGILRNPVIRKFVLREDIKLEKKAGISALCEYSLLSDNAYPTYAVTKKKLKASGVKMEKQASVSEDIGCVVLELGYFIDFFGKGLQDPLSVALSLTREEQEERVKISVNEMLEEYVWSKD